MIPTIAAEELREWLDSGKPASLVDVRPASEWVEGAIPGSIHVDAHDALRANDPGALADLTLTKDKPVVTVCGAGKTSLLAARQLCARGYNALCLECGMKA